MEIRKLKKSDGEKFLNLLLRLDHETKFMLYEPGERKTTPQEMETRLESMIQHGVVFAVEKNDEWWDLYLLVDIQQDASNILLTL